MMTQTRANVEQELIRRVGPLMTAVGLDGTTVDGTNLDLNDPIGYGITNSGGSVTAPSLVTDADVATVPSANYYQLLDISEWRTLQTIQNNAALLAGETSIGPRKEKNTLSDTIDKMLERKDKLVRDEYGLGLPAITSGVINWNFQASGDDTVIR